MYRCIYICVLAIEDVEFVYIAFNVCYTNVVLLDSIIPYMVNNDNVNLNIVNIYIRYDYVYIY